MKTNVQNIVITGIGLVTSLGKTPEETWQGVLASRPSLGPMPALENPSPEGKGGYQAVDLPIDFLPNLPREVRYLRWTIEQAIENAKLGPSQPYNPKRCGFVLGTTLHGMRAGGQFLRDNNREHLIDFNSGNTLQQAIAGLPFLGDAVTTCSACSSSLGSIALAITLLESNELDLVVSGGYDTVSEYAYGGFNSLRLVTDGPPKPFSKNRQGMKLGEGYGIVVIERADAAEQRGGKALVSIIGWGESADAHHLTQPHPQGAGAAAAVRGALARANLSLDGIDMIAAHATATPDNDTGEYTALAAVFGEQLPKIPVVGFKSHVGHTLGGAGAVELILSALSIRDSIAPAVATVTADEVEFSDLSLTTDKPKTANLRTTLNTSLGFGGANTAAILASPAALVTSRQPREMRDVFITGVGIALPGVLGKCALAERFASRQRVSASSIPEAEFIHLLNARKVRRLSDYVKISLAATVLAYQDAGLADLSVFNGEVPVLLGTTQGSSTYCIDYYRQIVEGGYAAANPMLFAEGVPNAASAHHSLQFGLRGACQTVIGSRTSGLDALRLASLRIASGQWTRAIVGAAEECVPLVNEAYRNARIFDRERPDSPFIGSGAVTFLLESRQSLDERGGNALAKIDATAASGYGNQSTVSAIADVLQKMGAVQDVISSANGTWVDRAEGIAIRRAKCGQEITVHGILPELLSAGPLAAIAARLASESSQSFAVLSTGFSGTVAGAKIKIG